MPEMRRYRVEQLSVDGWAEVARFDDYKEADELADTIRASGVVGVRLFDAQLGDVAWSVVQGR